jgi:putative ABC transport system permease protein
MLWESFKLALRSVRRNVLRSILTLLGIVIGVAAVIALVTIGSGANEKISSDISKLGSNMLIVRPGNQGPGPPGGNDARSFTENDVSALRGGVPQVRAIAPTASNQSTVVYDATSTDAQITGADEAFFVTQDWTFIQGGSFTESDVRAASNVCVIGTTIVTTLLPNIEPIGQTIRVGAMPCTVVGVLGSKGQSAFGSDQDNIVVMPLRTFQRRIAGNTKISNISVSANTPAAVKTAQDSITAILRETRHIGENDQDDFSVRDMTQIAATMSSTTTLMTGLLGAVAAVSLLVGGIGIMNIMLVSVTERTREIGIRLAIGALASQVLTQFLVEAVVLCLLGGLLGIGLGLGLAGLASVFLTIPFAPDPKVILLAFGFSGVIGLVFGFFPARNAARLDPIEALRHE